MKHLVAISFFAILLIGDVCEANQRSYHAIKQFKLQNPCPSTGHYKGRCPGYVIDHIKALACGGEDTPKNMQWQTVEDAKVKDKWERKNCIKIVKL